MAMNDWNQNGKSDAFDHYVDYKLSGGNNESSGRSSGGGTVTSSDAVSRKLVEIGRASCRERV